MRESEKEKRANDEVNGQGEKRVPRPHTGKLQSRITRQTEEKTDRQDMLRQNFSHGETDRPI